MKKSPTLAEWKKLYEAVMKVKDIEPWLWLEEIDLFAVENPETRELGFVSVMGAIGEHYSIAVYLGEISLARFWHFQESESDDFSYQKLLEMRQLQASFEDRNFLHKDDRQIIKELSLTFRGRNEWPMFRKYEPGFYPWFINASEARFLTHALEQTVNVALRAEEDPSILLPDDDYSYLLRRKVKRGSSHVWQDDIWHESMIDPELVEPVVDMIALEKAKHLALRNVTVEVDLFMIPQPTLEEGSEPFYPYIIVLLETSHGMIVGHKVAPPLPDLESMQAKIPLLLLNIFSTISYVPAKIRVDSPLLYGLFEHLSEHLDITIEKVDKLQVAPEARASFLKFANR
ncbi:hypothetical protein EH223_10365 [candidate division KSB1 bacterium]|nr:hypothetical protein [candidate division KSB1 bacterium]RQW03284.1 MAG: hypothetical protein EH223_10365 [candidate division KSB1 bacterium]